jgi:formylglycine-generating enzyme required for sulfatase activity
MSILLTRLNTIIFCFAAFSSLLFSQGAQIAVQSPISDSRVDSFFKHKLRGMLEEAVVNSASYKVVDRARTDQILKEQIIQRSGFVRNSDIKDFGKTLGVDYILTSEVQLSDSQKSLSVTCSLVNVETAEIIRTANITADNNESGFETACYMLISKLQLGQLKAAVQEIQPIPSDGLAKEIKNSVGMDLILIQAGEFIMGNPRPNDLSPDTEKPSHKVTISQPFYMARYPITQEVWREVMGNNPSIDKGNEKPVTNVSWEDARAFCKALSKLEGRECRLPTEAEWEFACKAGSLNGNYEPLKDFAWYGDNSRGNTHPIGQKEPNKWGLYDMLGNVGEWCLDWFGPYPSRQLSDPTGPNEGRERIVRGGGYSHSADKCKPTARNPIPPHEKYNFIGFRIISVINGH